jgi:HEAT repeat protein
MPQLMNCPPLVSRRPAAALLAVAILGVGFALGQAPPPDAVEEFRQALKLEQYARNEEKLALKHRATNLDQKAGNVKSLSDLSRALLLTEWQTDAAPSVSSLDFDFEARQIDHAVRNSMTRRFASGIQKVLASRNPYQQAAAANLLSETVVGASTLGVATTRARDRDRSLNKQLAALAANLVPLTGSPSAEVRVAAARALGNFPTEPVVVVGALKALLDPGWDARTRLTAAEALGYLVQVVAARQIPQRSSEPGVGNKPDRARNLTFERSEEVRVYDLVVPAAVRGLGDPDPAVRRASINAIREVTLSLRDMIPNVEQPPEYIVFRKARMPFPPPDRLWTDKERNNVNEGRAEVRELHQDLDRVLPGFRKNVRALTDASGDADPEVRTRARQVLEDLAACKRLLTNLDAFLPKDPAEKLQGPLPEKPEKPAGKLLGVTLGAPVQAVPGPLPRAVLGPPALPARPLAATGPAPALVLVRLEQAGQVKKAPDTANDPLTVLVDQARLALVQEGLRDPDPNGRLAAIDALEVFGAGAEPAVPALAAALGDRNKFVRWAAARALGRMAEAVQRAGRRPTGEREAVPGLQRIVLRDQDLDVRVAALEALRRYGPTAAAAVPTLKAALGRGDTEARLATLRALAAIGRPAAKPSLPWIARAMKNPDPRLRSEAALTLGTFAADAEPYLSDLRQAMQDADSDVRKAASEAILRITLGQ